MKKVLFIASTGGHLSELLQLKPIFDHYDYHIVTEKTKSNLDLKTKYHHVSYLIAGTYTTPLAKLIYPFKLALNTLKSFFIFLKVRPDVVVTTGTHTAVPMCYVAHYFKKKVVFIETFANRTTPTKSGRMVYPIADTFIIQWEALQEFYPNAIYLGWIY